MDDRVSMFSVSRQRETFGKAVLLRILCPASALQLGVAAEAAPIRARRVRE